tara:strand:- start:1284 stop:2159 length:876 start_codon:yes stop_codon:yes gene_type:complete
MGLFDDLVKVALPVAAGAFLGPAAGGLFSGATGIMANPAIQSALLTGGLGLLTGQKPKDALKSALLGGLGQAAFSGMGQAGQAAGQTAGSAAGATGATGGVRTGFPTTPGAAAMEAARKVTPPPSIEPVAAKTFSGELLQGLGLAGDPQQENLLFKLLNTNVGEGLAAGLVAQLLAGDDDEDVDNRGSFERRPYGAGGPGGKLGGINYAQGGIVQHFNQGGAMQNYPANPPRRDGPINPYEGSGTKDDVPALLTAGEFVMTRDAVKGAGGGDLNQGLNRMYNMMDKFEAMA